MPPPPSKVVAEAVPAAAADAESSSSKSSKKKKGKKHQRDEETVETAPAAAESSSDEEEQATEKEKKKKNKKAKKKKKDKTGSEQATVPAVDSAEVAAAKAALVADEAAAVRLFVEASPRHDRMVMHYVSTVAQVAAALADLATETIVGVDCEGVSLSRTGALCLVQVSTAARPNHNGDPKDSTYHVYLFDVTALGEAAFDSGLRAMLQAPAPIKLFFDCRRDSEALYHQFGVELRGVLDMQLLEVALRRMRNQSIVYLPGLGRLIGDKFSDLDTRLLTIKDGMSSQYAEAPDLWQRRPLTWEQNVYAAVDVALLHILLEDMMPSPANNHAKTANTKPAPALMPGQAAPAAAPAEEEQEEAAEEEAAATAAAADEKEAKEQRNIETALAKLTGGSVAPAAATDATDDSAPAAVGTDAAAAGGAATPATPKPKRVFRGSRTLINDRARDLIMQYSDVVWAAMTRDVEGEIDTWSRRHVPLDFHHATFPLSLQAACTSVLAAKQAKMVAAQAEKIAAEKAKKRKKRKLAASAGPKISASFSVAASSSSAAAAPASSAAPASLSSFVQRMVRTPAARNNYSGLANTLKLMRSQAPTAATTAAAPAAAATAASASSRGATASSSKGGRQVPQAAVVPSAASGGAGAVPPATAAAAVARLPLNSHIGNPDTFHPQVTKEFVAQHNKVANQPSLKRQKINPAF